MAALDWIFAVVLLLSMALGAWRGLVYEVLSLVNWVVAFVLARKSNTGLRSGVSSWK